MVKPGLLLLAATAVSLSSLPALSAPLDATLEAGKRVYERCTGCHSPERSRAGPLHCGLLGRMAGSVSGYSYSRAMRNAAITWTRETLDVFLRAPLEMLPGTSMGFSGIANDAERHDLIEWLATLSAASELCNEESEY